MFLLPVSAACAGSCFLVCYGYCFSLLLSWFFTGACFMVYFSPCFSPVSPVCSSYGCCSVPDCCYGVLLLFRSFLSVSFVFMNTCDRVGCSVVGGMLCGVVWVGCCVRYYYATVITVCHVYIYTSCRPVALSLPPSGYITAANFATV